MKRIKIASIVMAALMCIQQAVAQTDSNASKVAKVPFDGYDLTWINGQNRQTDFPLQRIDKSGETIL